MPSIKESKEILRAHPCFLISPLAYKINNAIREHGLAIREPTESSRAKGAHYTVHVPPYYSPRPSVPSTSDNILASTSYVPPETGKRLETTFPITFKKTIDTNGITGTVIEITWLTEPLAPYKDKIQRTFNSIEEFFNYIQGPYREMVGAASLSKKIVPMEELKSVSTPLVKCTKDSIHPGSFSFLATFHDVKEKDKKTITSALIPSEIHPAFNG